jgi:AP-1 complex subunit gamma-1
VNGIAKLANRLPSFLMPTIKRILARYGTSMNLELQQRSVEFSSLFNKVIRVQRVCDNRILRN